MLSVTMRNICQLRVSPLAKLRKSHDHCLSKDKLSKTLLAFLKSSACLNGNSKYIVYKFQQKYTEVPCRQCQFIYQIGVIQNNMTTCDLVKACQLTNVSNGYKK